ncbi:MAG: nucleotide exchange factor GrpE, partial [Desulfobulbaceae bacterium]|nr:nucleotide exchange factor GrpE [Desulfobulbaceae bacterium]
MNDRQEELVAQFREYLEMLPEEGDVEEHDDRHMDLFSLHGELTALKNEVRIESRQFKGALDDFRSVFSTLENANKTMAEKLEAEREEKALIESRTRRPLLMGLLDIYDRIDAGMRALADTPTPFPSVLCRRQTAALKAFEEGQQMVATRITDLLASCGVFPIKAVGERFDPTTMRAVSTLSDSTEESDVVVEEIRKGFT